MATDSAIRRVAQKEMRLFFASPAAWLFLGGFAAAALFIFFWVESFFARNIADVRPLFEWMPLLSIFLCAVLTMRAWSEERRSGTLEHVLAQPAGPWRFVLGKFLACLALFTLALASTLPLPVTVALIADLDPGPAAAGYLASVLLGAAYIAIGLCVSARTDNAIVSLIGTVAVCGALYFLGSPAVADFFDQRTADLLRALGTGARFDSIERGVLDVQDLFYYVSLTVAFLALNTFLLERERWARGTRRARHRNWRAATALLLANLFLGNLWLGQIPGLRLDTTEGSLYSISRTTRNFLDQLEEPLLIRGYFSARTHPLLAPLVPQLQDLLREYAEAGGSRVQVEFVDPASDPELEAEANERYGISATPFQIADRHQSALVNAYFNVLVRYGDEQQVLGFSDLIEVRTAANRLPEVLLRNPEYDITAAIKKVMSDYRLGGNLFDGIEEPVEFIGYVSADDKLPPALREYRREIGAQLEHAAQRSGGKFSARFIEPEARDGTVARQIEQEWGFRPMVASLDSDQAFYFYMTLADGNQVVQLPTRDFDAQNFRLFLDAGLKRFTRGFGRSVAMVLPRVDEQLAQFSPGGPTFRHLEQAVARDHDILIEDLADGAVSPEADILAVIAPSALDAPSLFAIDQFLMRGGTVVLATSPFTAELSGGRLLLQDWPSGLGDWLRHNGLDIEPTLVLDAQNSAFPAPVLRRSGDYEFRDVRMLDYPYFIDLRPPGLSPGHPITATLRQLTMAWASPIRIAQDTGRRSSPLLRSSPRSWRSDDPDIMPRLEGGDTVTSAPPPGGATGSSVLGVAVQGRFDSWFARDGIPPEVEHARAEGELQLARGGLLRRSPESARIVLYASNDFLDDQVLASLVAATGTQYLGPVNLFLNTLDWALSDHELLGIRSRGHFNRSLPHMEREAQELIEYFNYGLALAWLGCIGLCGALSRALRRRRYARRLGL